MLPAAGPPIALELYFFYNSNYPAVCRRQFIQGVVLSDKKKILIVDDDAHVGILIAAIFKKFNYDMIPLYSGKELMDYLKKSKPDLILLDLKLPDINGLDLCRKIRENPYYSDIPVLILSGVAEVDARVDVIETGADDYITKPFDVRELRARINRALNRKKVDTSLNPLTALPGSPAIEEFIKSRIKNNRNFGFAYVDADNFKSYNDVYGYSKGDEVIKKIADVIITAAKRFSAEDYFIGHVGGDDFVVITAPDKTEDVVAAINAGFDSEIPSFYSETDRKNGYISTLDRQNKMKTFPLMTLSVAVVIPNKPTHYAKIIENAFEIKRYLKSFSNKKTSRYHKDRRINE